MESLNPLDPLYADYVFLLKGLLLLLGEVGLDKSICAIFGEFLALFADVFYLTGLIDFLPDLGDEFKLFDPYKLFLLAISL